MQIAAFDNNLLLGRSRNTGHSGILYESTRSSTVEPRRLYGINGINGIVGESFRYRKHKKLMVQLRTRRLSCHMVAEW